jgi:hypothetical protein
MCSIRQAISVARISTALLWPATTWAASVTLSQTINSVPASAWVIVFVLATVSGLVSLLQRLKDEMMKPEGETQIRRAWKWFTAAHLAGALFMGLLSFLIAEAFDLKDYWEAIFIALMSWAGARAVDRLSDGLIDGTVGRLSSMLGSGGQQNNPPPKP